MIFRFCPRCGKDLKIEPRDNQRVPVCKNSDCGFIFWQSSKLCVAVVLADKMGRVLLTRRKLEPELNKLDLPGGFLLPGEKPERGAIRETAEEVGVKIKVTDFLGHYPDRYWYQGISEYIMTVGLAAKNTSGRVKIRDKREIAEIRWLDPREVKSQELAFTGNAKILKAWTKSQKSADWRSREG